MMYGNGRMMIPNCLDALSRFCLLPWAVILLRQSLGRISNRDDSSWGIVMCAYGALVSMLNAGRVVGRWYRNRDRMSLSYIAVLGMSFVLLTLTTRYSCLLLVFYIIGFCSSRICSNDIDDCSRSGVNKSICNSVYNSVGNETCYNQADIDYANAIKTNIVLFTVSTLLSGVLYEAQEMTLFPAREACRLVAFLAFAAYLFLSADWIKRKLLNCRRKKGGISNKKGINNVKQNITTATDTTDAATSEIAVNKIDESREISTDMLAAADDGNIPSEFLQAFKNDKKKARNAYIRSLCWRRDHHIDTILSNPHHTSLYTKNFLDILHLYPHCLQGLTGSETGNGPGDFVVFELLGRSNAKELSRLGITPSHLVKHFILRNEFIFQQCFSDSNAGGSKGKILSILDVKDISIYDITSDVISFIQVSSEIMDTYYPNKVSRLIICNTPYFFSAIWTVIARVLPAAVQEKIILMSGHADLLKYIDASSLPPSHGGTGPDMFQSQSHRTFSTLGAATADAGTTVGTKESHGIHATITAAPVPIDTTDAASSTVSSIGSWFKVNSAGASSSATQAYMGEKNQFKYDAVSSKWYYDNTIVDSNSRSSSSSSSSSAHANANSNSSYLEEHGVVLAIQAAHLAAIRNRERTSSSSSSSSGSNSIESSSPSSRLPPNGDVFVIILCIYMLSCTMQVGLFTIMPVYMSIDVVQGGLGYSVLDASLVLSMSGFFLYLIALYGKDRLTYIVRTSATKGIRIGCTMLMLSSITMPLLLSDTVGNRNIFFSADAAIMAHLSSIKTVYRPCCSLLYLLIPSGILSVIISSCFYLRRVSSILLQSLLHQPRSTGYNSLSILSHIGSIIDVTCPAVLSLIYSSTFRHHLHYPMDASFFFSLSSCISPILYILSLLLRIQYTGDFGTITADTMNSTTNSSKSSSGSSSGSMYIATIVYDDIHTLFSCSSSTFCCNSRSGKSSNSSSGKTYLSKQM